MGDSSDQESWRDDLKAYHCPGCDEKLMLPTYWSGQRVRCKSCSQMFVIPVDGLADSIAPADLAHPAEPTPSSPPREQEPLQGLKDVERRDNESRVVSIDVSQGGVKKPARSTLTPFVVLAAAMLLVLGEYWISLQPSIPPEAARLVTIAFLDGRLNDVELAEHWATIMEEEASRARGSTASAHIAVVSLKFIVWAIFLAPAASLVRALARKRWT
ncbi:MAG: hypothetical protein V3W34_03370 [Phycisphaerae bacterium]